MENNINFFIEKDESKENTSLALDLENTDVFFENMKHDNNNNNNNNSADIFQYELAIPQILDYNFNYTLKGLLNICEYYGIAKNLKACKSNKEQIIDALVFFENDPTNFNIIYQRQKLWFYMDELKKDKFMKKFILCWN